MKTIVKRNSPAMRVATGRKPVSKKQAKLTKWSDRKQAERGRPRP